MIKLRCGSLGRFVILAAIVAALLPVACGKGSTQNFVRDAGISNQFEILSSQLALQKSQNDQIKQFAQHMIDDHTKAGNELQALAQADNAIPQPPTSLDARHQRMLDELSSASDFDREFVNMQVDAHNSAVSLFSNYAKNGDNDALKRFASETLPTLQEHQQMITQLKSTLTTP